MGYIPAARAAEKCGSMGVAIPGGSFSLEDEGQVLTSPAASGELVYRGPNVAMGCAESPGDLVLGDQWGGVLHTGDLAWRDGGRLLLRYRQEKLYGNRVGLDETERLLYAWFPGADFACTGGDKQMLIFTDSADPALPHAAVHCLSKLMRLPPSAFIVHTDISIPKNEEGKTVYTQLTAAEAD